MSDAIQQMIKASVANGLTKPAIEALLGRDLTADEIQAYRKAKAVYDLQLRKRRTERKYEHLSGAEVKRKFDDRACSIDQKLDDARARINWQRRNAAEASPVEFIKTYLVGLMMPDAPSPRLCQVVEQMAQAILQNGQPLQLLLARGTGKSTVAQALALWLILSARKRFVVIVAHNHTSAAQLLKDIARPLLEPDTALVQDYPELLAFQLCGGSFRRRQLYRGLTTDLQKTANSLVFPRLGDEYPTSGACVLCRGIASGIRGINVSGLRPDCVLIDDAQDSGDAESSQQVEKLWGIIRKDILGLGGKRRISCICCQTPICADDLCAKIASDKGWKTLKYPAIEQWPRDILEHPDDGLWAQYFKMYDAENIEERPHDDSLRFYRENQAQMDDGAQLFSPDRFSPDDGHISGLQALLLQRRLIGESAFLSEYQMEAKRFTFALDITPHGIIKKAIDLPALAIPDGTQLVIASTDLNLSYALTTSIIAFRAPDMSAHVLWHEFRKCGIDTRLPDAEFSAAVTKYLTQLGKHLASLGVHIDGWGIDASGTPFNAVCAFSKNSHRLCGLRAVAMVGRANHMFNPFLRSRLRDAIHDTILCGNPEERIKAGSGQKWLVFNADKWRETFHKSLLAPIGAAGSLTLHEGSADDHAEWANQVANERLVLIAHKKDGRDVYTWRTKEPHDAGDTGVMAYALCANLGISGETQVIAPTSKNRQLLAKLIAERKKLVIK